MNRRRGSWRRYTGLRDRARPIRSLVPTDRNGTSCPIPVILPNANPGVHVIEGRDIRTACFMPYSPRQRPPEEGQGCA
jgi:hypothetical protein